MRKLFTILFCIIGILSINSRINACDYCLLSQGLSPLQTTTGIGIRIDERYTVLDKMYRGTEKIDNPGNKETHLTTQVTGFYAINPELTALVVLPYVRRTHEEWHTHIHEGGEIEMEFHEGKAWGLGDVVLMGRYTFFRRHELDTTTLLAGQVGVKLPTGTTDKKDNTGAFIDAHGQPGTGSTDIHLGLNFSHAVRRLTLTTNLLYSINNKGEAGGENHEFGDWFTYDVTGIYRIYPATPPGPTVSLALGIAGEWRDKEKLSGEEVEDSGGHVLYLNTGILFIPRPKWVLELNHRPSIYHNLNGEQLGEDYKTTLSLTYLF